MPEPLPPPTPEPNWLPVDPSAVPECPYNHDERDKLVEVPE